jgi:hypothetical protein
MSSASNRLDDDNRGVRQAAGQQFVAHRAQRIHVAARIGIARVALQLFGAHVGQGAHHLADLGHVAADFAMQRRRTFAIISHPDAGKTTLTEKLLLFGGAIQMAGTVKGRKAARHATSDWMELEKQRGISVTSR